MNITVIFVLVMLVLFAGIFYYTHRESDETNSVSKSNETEGANETTAVGEFNETTAVGEFNGTTAVGKLNGTTAVGGLNGTTAVGGLNGTATVAESAAGGESLAVKIRRVLPPLWESMPQVFNKKSNGTAPATESAPELENEKPPLTSRVTEVLNGWPLFNKNKNENNLAQQFNEWVAGAPLEKRIDPLSRSAKGMKSWLASLEAEERDIFTKQVAAFTSDLNFELGWLVDQELENDPDLKQAMEEVVALYCLANFKALLLQDELRAFIILQAWQEEPTRKEYQEFNQKLFTKLVGKGFAEAAPSDLLLAGEKEREKYAVQAIRQAYQENRKAFKAIAKEIMAEDDSVPADDALQPEPVMASA